MIWRDFLQTQDWLLRVSPGLLPLAALLYSALSSWHCSLMCGPLVYSQERRSLHRFLLWRLLGYTAAGSLFGFTGQWLKDSLEFQLLNVLAFLVLVIMTVFFVLPQLVPRLPKVSLPKVFAPILQNASFLPVRGALLAAVPCHLLVFYYGLAVLTSSPLWGGALLFGHAVMTTPALAFAWQFTARLSRSSAFLRNGLRVLMLVMIVTNLCYFGGRLLYPADEVGNHFMFCW